MKAATLVLFALIDFLSTCFVYAETNVVQRTPSSPALTLCTQNMSSNEMQNNIDKNK